MYLQQIIKQFEDKEPILNPDLTNENHLIKIQELADNLYSETKIIEEIKALEEEMIKEKNAYSLISHSAIKITKSKQILSETKDKIHLTIIFAVYKEHYRILTKEEHEHGEDFLMRKIKQMEDLTGDFENISWDMIIVDDGCPENSGKIAEKILKDRYKGNNVEVLYLQDAINSKNPVVKNIKTTDDSRKGGSVEYGMWYAANKNIKNHIIIYTDADLSTHLGQCGLLVDGIVNDKKNVAIASRREPESVVLKTGNRNVRGKLFIYFWKRMLRRLNYIVDTQCGFKAFKAEIVNKIILDTIEKKFAFDIELLLKTDILKRESIKKVPIAWIDSAKESTTTDLQPYLDMLKAITKMYHKYVTANAGSHLYAYFVKSLTEEQWNILENHVPEGIQIKSPVHYDIYSETTVDDFKKIIERYSKTENK
ncbi:MAG: glycosyltransferase [Bacteroidales bacterium]|nr:glycosyltransferase [Bacteroidales bacterium]